MVMVVQRDANYLQLIKIYKIQNDDFPFLFFLILIKASTTSQDTY